MKKTGSQNHFLPGFGLSLGFTLVYLSLLVLVPLSLLSFRALSLDGTLYRDIFQDPRTLAAFKLTFASSFIAAGLNLIFGFIVAWTLVRFPFPGCSFIDALIDLPFALPTAVSGIALTSLYVRSGMVGRYLDIFGIQVAFAPLGVVVALSFISLPFVIRSLQPALKDIEREYEEAAISLGASPISVFFAVIFPAIRPALLTGFSLAFARALGEYGSVVFISGNMPMKTEIISLLIAGRMEQFDYDGATALAAVTLLASFMILLSIHLIQWHYSRKIQPRS
ncbi:MAG: sulfate ABC transporter permease subunit CysT [Candidatus Hydrogenedens sp.]|nr:sulfate ABC transporter permease subunit CysT [Candidatus Hydrogenedens sp.]